jgi:hypothetical protein
MYDVQSLAKSASSLCQKKKKKKIGSTDHLAQFGEKCGGAGNSYKYIRTKKEEAKEYQAKLLEYSRLTNIACLQII